MIHVLADVQIADIDTFLKVFGADGLSKRAQHGSRGARVFTHDGESGRVVVLLEFDQVADFEAFRSDPEAPPIMRRGGAQGPPRFTILHQVGDYAS